MKEFKQAGPERQPSGAWYLTQVTTSISSLWMLYFGMSILGHMETIQHTEGPTSKPYEHRRTHPQAIC